MNDVAQPNIYSDEWQRSIEHGRFGVRGTQVGRQAGCKHVGVSVYELDPGKTNMPYHAHFGTEEVLVVLRGTPALRTPEGERELAEGEVVSFPPGRDGAHQLANRSEGPVRYLMLSSKAMADVIEYPDSEKVSAQGGEWGTPDAIGHMLPIASEVGYFEGEDDS